MLIRELVRQYKALDADELLEIYEKEVNEYFKCDECKKLHAGTKPPCHLGKRCDITNEELLNMEATGDVNPIMWELELDGTEYRKWWYAVCPICKKMQDAQTPYCAYCGIGLEAIPYPEATV